jgi:hypothetical protein
MVKAPAFLVFFALLGCTNAFAQTGACSQQSSKLACVLPEEYGSTPAFTQVLYSFAGHPFHFESDFGTVLQPFTSDIGRQVNLLPLASPSSGVIYDPSLKTFVSEDSLGPVLGERAETVGRHRFFIGFSYQYFNFDKLDGINLQNFPAILTHTDDNTNNSTSTAIVNCSISPSTGFSLIQNSSLNGCGFVRDRIDTLNSINLKVNEYTTYLTFGLTRHVDLSVLIPIETVQMSISSQATIVPGTNGDIVPVVGSSDQTQNNQCAAASGSTMLTCTSNGPPYFFHLFKNCPNTSPSTGLSGLAPQCLVHTFPDPSFTGSGSAANNSATGIGDVVARVKWNAFEGERAGIAVGLDMRFPTGDALNYLGSGSYGVKPFAVFSYRWRISPHALVGVGWNSDSVTAGDLSTGTKGNVPNEFDYTVGADARVTRWLTGAFDIVGQRFFDAETVSEVPTAFLNNCGSCTADPNPKTVTLNNLKTNTNASYNITNASLGIKARPFPGLSRLVFTANVLIRLDNGGLGSKASPLVGLGYTF